MKVRVVRRKFGTVYQHMPSDGSAPYCACECGELVITKNRKDEWNVYINGHQRRLYNSIEVAERKVAIPPLCECGCGESTLWSEKYKAYNRYVKGHELRGRVVSEETRKKLSITSSGKNNGMYGRRGKLCPNFGKPKSEKTKAKISKKLKGRKHSEERKIKISRTKTGSKQGPHSKEHRENLSKAHKGKKLSEEHKRNLRLAKAKIDQTGKNNPNWQGGHRKNPYVPEFNIALKREVRERDNYTCQICGKTEEEVGKKLSVHHIDYNKKNNNPDNLISLCNNCHGKTGKDREEWEKTFVFKIAEKKYGPFVTGKEVQRKAIALWNKYPRKQTSGANNDLY